jgi:hypothetical protein
METSRTATQPTTRSRFHDISFSRTLAVRLKVAVIAAACVLGVALGFASASLGPRLIGSHKSGARTVSLEDFQVILQRQAEVAAEGPATAEAR